MPGTPLSSSINWFECLNVAEVQWVSELDTSYFKKIRTRVRAVERKRAGTDWLNELKGPSRPVLFSSWMMNRLWKPGWQVFWKTWDSDIRGRKQHQGLTGPPVTLIRQEWNMSEVSLGRKLGLEPGCLVECSSFSSFRLEPASVMDRMYVSPPDSWLKLCP